MTSNWFCMPWLLLLHDDNLVISYSITLYQSIFTFSIQYSLFRKRMYSRFANYVYWRVVYLLPLVIIPKFIFRGSCIRSDWAIMYSVSQRKVVFKIATSVELLPRVFRLWVKGKHCCVASLFHTIVHFYYVISKILQKDLRSSAPVWRGKFSPTITRRPYEYLEEHWNLISPTTFFKINPLLPPSTLCLVGLNVIMC